VFGWAIVILLDVAALSNQGIVMPRETGRWVRHPHKVLPVEDGPGDVRFAQEAFKDAKVHINLHVATDGAKAMAFLKGDGEPANGPLPDLIVLDLNLPKKDGREVLAVIKENLTLKSIPAVILTTSSSDADILLGYQLHTNCYITKPVGLEGRLTVMQSIDSFWPSVVKPPEERRS
jgi:CheY-like chemotaxis protein